MKKTVVVLLALLLAVCLVGCSKKVTAPDSSTAPVSSPVQEAESESEEPQKEQENTKQEITPDNWGVPEVWSADTETTSQNYRINFPNFSGYTEGGAMIAEQLDGTVAMIAGQFADSPEVDALSNLFPTYFSELEFALKFFYGLGSSNFEFSVESNAPVTVGDVDMHSFEGTIKFDYDGEARSYKFVSYATQLKKTGAYAYWVVYDVSEDQSNGGLIAEHALNMAKTFREEE